MSACHFSPVIFCQSPSNILREESSTTRSLPELRKERRGTRGACSSLAWNEGSWLTPRQSRPEGGSGEGQGELHGHTTDGRRGEGNKPVFCHCSLPWLIPSAIPVAVGHAWGSLWAEGSQGCARSGRQAQAGKILSERGPSSLGSSSHHWDQARPPPPAASSYGRAQLQFVPAAGPLLGRGGGAALFRRTGRKAAWAGDAERQRRRACGRSARLVARLLLLQSLELSLGVFVKYGATLASQKSLFFSVRGKRGGGREQNFKTMANVRVLTWLRYSRDWRNLVSGNKYFSMQQRLSFVLEGWEGMR